MKAMHRTNLEENRIGIDSDGYGVFIWWPHKYFYDYVKCPSEFTERDWLDGIHEFEL